jgi:acyl carrier protein
MELAANDVIAFIKKAGLVDVDVEALATDVPLTEQGLDSLDLMTVFLEIEETHGIRIPDEDYEGLRTVDEIAIYLTQRLAS